MAEMAGEFAAALQAAMELSRASGARYLGTEHLLLGALRYTQIDVVQLLAKYGVTYQTVSAQNAVIFPASLRTATPTSSRTHPPTPALAQVTEKAASAITTARAMGGGTPRVAHLVAALLAEQGLSTALFDPQARARGMPLHEFVAELEQQVRSLLNRG